jgi:hypothetical protein
LPHPAESYNRIRRIVLSAYNRDPSKLHEYESWVEKYRAKGELDQSHYIGMLAELRFLAGNERRFALTPCLDVGDGADFTGSVDGQHCRIDVTTNIDYKNLKKYEPLQLRGHYYKIAICDRDTGGLLDIVDVNFPFCAECNTGRMFLVGVLLKDNFNDKGESRWTNDQALVQVCAECVHRSELQRISTPFMYDFSQYREHLAEERANIRSAEADLAVQAYAVEVRRYLRRAFDAPLFGVGGIDYVVTNPRDGDGEQRICFEHRDRLVSDYLRHCYRWDSSNE